MSLSKGAGLAVCLATAASMAVAQQRAGRWKPDIPRVGDGAALRDWATPLAGLNARPTHLSSKEYYAFEIHRRKNLGCSLSRTCFSKGIVLIALTSRKVIAGCEPSETQVACVLQRPQDCAGSDAPTPANPLHRNEAPCRAHQRRR